MLATAHVLLQWGQLHPPPRLQEHGHATAASCTPSQRQAGPPVFASIPLTPAPCRDLSPLRPIELSQLLSLFCSLYILRLPPTWCSALSIYPAPALPPPPPCPTLSIVTRGRTNGTPARALLLLPLLVPLFSAPTPLRVCEAPSRALVCLCPFSKAATTGIRRRAQRQRQKSGRRRGGVGKGIG